MSALHDVGDSLQDMLKSTLFQSNANYVEIDQIYPLTPDQNHVYKDNYNRTSSPIYQNTRDSSVAR